MLFRISCAAMAVGSLMMCGTATAGEVRYGLPWDWSHRAHIHSPVTPAEAMARGEYDEWLHKSADPRYMSQVIRKIEAEAGIAEARRAEAAEESTAKARGDRQDRRERRRGSAGRAEMNRDWSNVMGGASGVGILGTFPAKYGFDISAAPDCVNDFVVYGTGVSGVNGAGNFAARNGTVTGTNPGNGTVTITNGARVLTLTRSATLNTGLSFLATNGNSVAAIAAKAANLAAAINRNGGTVGVRATSVGATVTLTAITQGTANTINVNENINFFSWVGGNGNITGGAGGTAGQPTIIAFNQLYKVTCDQATNPPVRSLPNTFWSYNTGGAVVTSPVLSLDGTQVAFMERNGAAASLVMLKWSSTLSLGTVGAPTVPPTAANPAAYRACAAPCMFKIALGTDNVRSSPYYDYAADSLYVGAANGTLHKFNGVFNGNPAAAGAPWPVSVSAGNALSSPVYEGNSGMVFVGSALGGAGAGGRLHRVSAAGAVVSSAAIAGTVGAANGTGVAESPMVDSSAQRVYTFVATDTSNTCEAGNDPCQAIHQFTTTFAANNAGVRSQIGRGGQVVRTLRLGAFDNAYWASTPTSPTGFLYVCGSTDADTDRPALWRIPIVANAMGAAVIGPTLTTPGGPDSGECSPITEVMNGANDYLFLSVPAAGNDTGCAGACIYMYNLTGIAWGAGVTAVTGLPAAGGTTGIIIDNISTTTGAAQIYYSTRTSPGNAIQASQAALN